MRCRTAPEPHQAGLSLPGESGEEALFVELRTAPSDVSSVHEGARVGTPSRIFCSSALPSIALLFAERYSRWEDDEVGGIAGSPEKNADCSIHSKSAAEGPGASRSACRTSVQVCTVRAK